jgi:hypothetical protein
MTFWQDARIRASTFVNAGTFATTGSTTDLKMIVRYLF